MASSHENIQQLIRNRGLKLKPGPTWPVGAPRWDTLLPRQGLAAGAGMGGQGADAIPGVSQEHPGSGGFTLKCEPCPYAWLVIAQHTLPGKGRNKKG